MSGKVKKNIEETENLVEEYMLGKVKIRIFDSAYINRTQEDIDRSFERITNIVTRVHIRKMNEQ